MCLAPGTKESISNVVQLPEEDPHAINYFVDYIYNDKVDFSCEPDAAPPAMMVYALAEKLKMPEWQNRVIDSLVECWKEHFLLPNEVSWVLDKVSDASPLLQLMLDQFSYEAAHRYDATLHEWTEKELQAYKKDLDALCAKKGFSATQLLQGALHHCKNPLATAPVNLGCKYHVHEDGERCKVKAKRRAETTIPTKKKRTRTNPEAKRVAGKEASGR